MRQLLLRCDEGPTENIYLTAAVRDLCKQHPGAFRVDVRTRYPQLWANNPHVSHLDEASPEVEQVDTNALKATRSSPPLSIVTHHILRYFSLLPGVAIAPSAFRGDLHLSSKEKGWMSQVQELTRIRLPFWVISAGGRRKESVTKWDATRFQNVVDAFRDRILFVQVGLEQEQGTTLDGVIDLRGRTDLRQLVRLVFHAQGVLSTPNLLVHLAAAIPTRNGHHNRACVVIAGGSQPHWQPYPTHHGLHTVGALTCCSISGCGRTRLFALGDGSPEDAADQLCVQPVGDLPRCMHIIHEGKVIRAIRRYFDGGLLEYLTPEETQVSQSTVSSVTERLRAEAQPAHIGQS
jgi:ADP-heptose:LPS heptosyltransferase